MKHAYLIIVHNELELLSNLVSLLDDERNDIYVHYDAKMKMLPPPITFKKSRLYVLKKINVHWGDFSQIEVEFELLQKAFSNGGYDYFHFLSGVDMPLKTQDYIHDFFDKNRGKEFIDFVLSDVSDEMNWKMRLWHLFPSNFQNIGRWAFFQRIIRALFCRLQVFAGFKRNSNIKFRKGSQWASITPAFAEYLLARRETIRKIYTHTFCPDEWVLQTECWNSPFRDRLYDYSDNYRGHMRLIDWGRGRPYVWRNEDYKELMSSDRLFARKFSSKYMEVVCRITDAVGLKSKKKDESS